MLPSNLSTSLVDLLDSMDPDVLLRTALLLTANPLFTLIVVPVHGSSCVVVDVLEGVMSDFEERGTDAFLVTILLDASLSLFDSLVGVVGTVHESVSQDLITVSSGTIIVEKNATLTTCE
jgi:hypothetical protein